MGGGRLARFPKSKKSHALKICPPLQLCALKCGPKGLKRFRIIFKTFKPFSRYLNNSMHECNSYNFILNII